MTAEGDRARAGAAGSPTTCAATRRRRRHLRRQPEHQLHQRLLRRLPVLRVRPAAHRRRRLLALPRRRSPTAPRRRGRSAPPRSACRAASTPSCPARRTSTSPRAVKQRVPGHARARVLARWRSSTAPARTGLSFEDFLIKAREAGLDTIPGTAAEILDDDVRWVLTKGKLPTRDLDRGRHAPRTGSGCRSSSTMMYGHVDNPRHWVAAPRGAGRHPGRRSRAAGSPSSCRCRSCTTSAPIYLAGVARPGPTLRDNLAVHAMARILLHGRIDNIQTSWVKLGVDGTRAMLHGRRQRPRRHADGGDHLAGWPAPSTARPRPSPSSTDDRRRHRPARSAQRTTTYGVPTRT